MSKCQNDLFQNNENLNLRKSGCGGVFRDDNGVWLGGFSKFVGYCSVVVAELWGILEGLKMAIDKGFKKVILVDKICLLITNLEKVILVHSFREINECALLLATNGKELQGGLVFYQVVHPFLVSAFAKDLSGSCSSRVVSL